MPAGLLAVALSGAASGATAAVPPSLLRLVDHPRGLEGPWKVRGRIAGDPSTHDRSRSRFELDVDSVQVGGLWRPLRGTVTVWVDEPAGGDSPLPGIAIEAFLRLRRDRPRANPGGWTRTRAMARGIWLRSGLKSYRQLRIRSVGSGVTALSARWRRRLRRSVQQAFVRHPAIVRALILGERGGLDPELVSLLARAGLAHLLAISGLHLGLVTGAVYLLGRALGRSPAVAAGLALVAVAAILITVVPRAPVRRAAIMAAAFLGGRLAGRGTAPSTGLALAVGALAVVRPAIVRDVGYQLTAAATLGIRLLAGPLTVALSRLRVPMPSVWSVTLSAQVGVAPVLAAATHRLALAAVVLNPLAIPLTGVIVGGSMVALTAGSVGLSGAAHLSARLAEAGIDAVILLARAADGRPGSTLVLPASARRDPPTAAAVPRLVALDVGQGDAILVDAPGGAVLVDAGGFPGIRYDTGAAIVAPALRALGVRQLQAVAVSHLHADHAGGVPGVLAEVPAREVWLGSVPVDDRSLERILEVARRRNASVLGLAAGAVRQVAGCRWRCLHPGGAWLRPGGAEVDNDASLVLELGCGGRSLLLTGDAELPAERLWVPRLRHDTGGAVLKVPHHGSRTSSGEELLELSRPRHAVISVGWRNRFGLPRDDVLHRYRRRGIAVYRTDRDGAVSVVLGRRIRVRGLRWTAGEGDPLDRLGPR